MGYRHYFYEIDNSHLQNIQKINSQNELAEYAKKIGIEVDDDYVSMLDLIGKKELFEFGKLYFDDTVEKIANTGKPLFINKELNERCSDYNPFVVGKEALEVAVEIYKNKIISSIEEDIKEPELEEKDKKILMPDKVVEAFIRHALPFKDTRSAGDKCKETLEDELRWIKYIGEEDKNNPYRLSGSWLYKHSIFTLIAILRFFDFENKSIVFMGW